MFQIAMIYVRNRDDASDLTQEIFIRIQAIAAILKIPLGTAQSHSNRARLELTRAVLSFCKPEERI